MSAHEGHEGGAQNGNGHLPPGCLLTDESTPTEIRDLAESCVKFVERALHVRLDYHPDTVSVLDHYLEKARSEASPRPDALRLVAHAAGAYFGELVRRRYSAWWRVEGTDPAAWRVELEPVYLAFQPVSIALDFLYRDALEGEHERYELDEADETEVRERLSRLAPVPDEEFFSLSTRLEVLDIIVEAIRARRIAAGDEQDAVLRPEDYDR